MHPSRLFDSLFLIYIYIAKHITKDVRSERKKKYAVDTEKKTKRIKFKIIQASHHKINERVKHYRHSEDSMQSVPNNPRQTEETVVSE